MAKEITFSDLNIATKFNIELAEELASKHGLSVFAFYFNPTENLSIPKCIGNICDYLNDHTYDSKEFLSLDVASYYYDVLKFFKNYPMPDNIPVVLFSDDEYKLKNDNAETEQLNSMHTKLSKGWSLKTFESYLKSHLDCYEDKADEVVEKFFDILEIQKAPYSSKLSDSLQHIPSNQDLYQITRQIKECSFFTHMSKCLETYGSQKYLIGRDSRYSTIIIDVNASLSESGPLTKFMADVENFCNKEVTSPTAVSSYKEILSALRDKLDEWLLLPQTNEEVFKSIDNLSAKITTTINGTQADYVFFDFEKAFKLIDELGIPSSAFTDNTKDLSLSLKLLKENIETAKMIEDRNPDSDEFKSFREYFHDFNKFKELYTNITKFDNRIAKDIRNLLITFVGKTFTNREAAELVKDCYLVKYLTDDKVYYTRTLEKEVDLVQHFTCNFDVDDMEWYGFEDTEHHRMVSDFRLLEELCHDLKKGTMIVNVVRDMWEDSNYSYLCDVESALSSEQTANMIKSAVNFVNTDTSTFEDIYKSCESSRHYDGLDEYAHGFKTYRKVIEGFLNKYRDALSSCKENPIASKLLSLLNQGGPINTTQTEPESGIQSFQ